MLRCDEDDCEEMADRIEEAWQKQINQKGEKNRVPSMGKALVGIHHFLT